MSQQKGDHHGYLSHNHSQHWKMQSTSTTDNQVVAIRDASSTSLCNEMESEIKWLPSATVHLKQSCLLFCQYKHYVSAREYTWVIQCCPMWGYSCHIENNSWCVFTQQQYHSIHPPCIPKWPCLDSGCCACQVSHSQCSLTYMCTCT